ncbi:hypothetical protein ACIRF8_15620 [Streptomyces sp. NPDC102406]|uniref:hypothetical protein n=1 Tax=Streptomyces sp. NPDC102406 TaxID=3366171 RepID=UPI003807259C
MNDEATGLEVPADREDIARAISTAERRPKRGIMQPKPSRRFTVYLSPEDPGRAVDADSVSTLGDWFTLSLNGREVFGARGDRVLCYTADDAAGEAA